MRNQNRMVISAYIPPRLLAYRLVLRLRYAQLLVILAPYFIRHFLRRHYRQDIPELGYYYPLVNAKRRAREALFDGMYNLLLDAYSDVTQSKCTPPTGKLLYLLIELSRHLDEFIDDSANTKTQLTLSQILSNERVQQPLDLFVSYVTLYTDPNPIKKYLQKQFDTLFLQYLTIIYSVQMDSKFERTLLAGKIDTGAWMKSVMSIVGLFNQHHLTNDMLNQFYYFGVVGKFADDIVDLKRDYRRGRANLLVALLDEHPVEHMRLRQAVQKDVRMDMLWWVYNCPVTITRYLDYVQRYYNLIGSRKLRLICDLLFLPAMLGKDHDPNR